jgi:hypothetical protein
VRAGHLDDLRAQLGELIDRRLEGPLNPGLIPLAAELPHHADTDAT